MAELDDAIRAFRNAHAAGDTAAATTLAKYIQQLEAQAPAPGGPFASVYEVSASPETPEGPTISGEFGRGLESLLSSLRTTGAAAFGDEEEAALAGLERQRQIGEEYGEGPSLESVLRTYEEDGLLSAVGEAGSQILPAVSGQLPIWAALGAGAMAGQAAIPVPILGGALGAAAVGLPMFFGSNIERQAETQLAEGRPVDISTGRALAAAAGQTALESAGAAATVGKGIVKSILKIADDTGLDSAAARDLTGAALAKLRGEAATPVTMGARAGAAGRGALTAAAVEMPTEMAQQVIERAQAGLDVLSPEALAEYGEAAYLAGIAGGTLGGVTRVGEPGRVQRRAETRLRDVAEQEAQDEFSAFQQELAVGDKWLNVGQPDLLGEIAPVMAPQTRAGEAQQEELRLQEQQREVYRTRGDEERFAPPGTLAEPALPTVVNDLDAFNYMKEQGLTEATALETIPQDPKNTDRKMFNAVKAQMNETALVELAAAEAARVPRAPGEAPLVIDTRKTIAEFDPAEREVLNRVVERIQSKAPAPGTQQPLPKTLTNILVGEKATAAKAEEAAAQLELDRKAEEKAQKQADREAQRAQAAADKEAQRVAAQAQKDAEAARKTGLAEIAPKKVDLIGSLQARKNAVELAQEQEAEDVAKAQKRQGIRPTAPTTQQTAPTTLTRLPENDADINALMQELGANKSAKPTFKKISGADLSDPAQYDKVLAALDKSAETTSVEGNRNAMVKLAERIKAQGRPQVAATPAVVDELGGDAIDTTTQRVEETTKDVQVPTPTKRPRAKKAVAPAKVVEEPKPKAEPAPKAEAKPKKAGVKKYTEDDFYGEGVSELDGTEALISFFDRDRGNPSLQKLVKESAKWVDDAGAKAMLEEAAKNIPGLMALENASNSPKLEGDLLDAVTSGNLKKTISLLLGKTAKRPEVQQILKRIQSMGLKTKIVVAPLGRPGEYDPVTDTATFDPELGLNEHTLTHELSHAALANQIANPNSKVAKEFGEFFQIVKNQLGGTYGGTNVQEFAAEIMGNEGFAAATKAMKAPKSGSLWDRIVQTIAEFFGFRKSQSVYDQAIKYIEELLNVPRTAEPTITEKLFMGTPKSAAEALTSIGKEVRPVTREAQSDFRKLLRKVDGVEPAFEGVYSTALKAAFSLMRLQNIYDIYKDAGSKYTPLSRALKKLSDSLERRLGEIERRSKVFNDKYNDWLKIANDKKYAAHMERMITLADTARRNGIDLVPENKFEPSKEQEQVFDRLKNVLNNLPKPVRDMYLEMRRDYDKEFQANREFLLDQYRDNPTAYAEMKAEFEAKHALKGYIPDMRFGDFVLEYTEAGTNRRVVQQFESRGERAQAIEELKLKDGEYETYSRITEAKYDQKKVPDGSFLRKVTDDLKKTNASQKQLDTVYQAYLSMFPAQSLAKRMMRSENVAGQSRDLLRGYAATMMQWVRHRANAQYSPIIDEALDDIQKQQDVGGVHTKALSDVLNSEGSKDFLHNPTFNPAISFATGVSFGAFILGNVSSALVNLTALPLGWNMLGAKYGYNDARKAMTDATKIITPLSLKDMTGDTKAWDNVPTKYRKLIDAMLDRGQLQHTQTREILEGRGKASAEMGSGVAGVMVKALDLGSRPFNAAEKVNRGAIGIAAYEMARRGGNGVAPMTEAAAIEYAMEVVKNINTSGTAATGPRAFQTAPGRLIGTFKGFALNQVAVLGIAAAKSFVGADPETKRIARRQVLGTYAVSGALAGVAGMPFVTGTVAVLNSVMQGLFGDDDDDYEYFNSQEWMQDVLADWAYKGPINAFLNLSVADRTAITNNLAPVPDPQLVEDVGYVRAMIIQLAGPAAGVAVNLEKAFTEAKEGRWERVPEYMLPTAGANLFKAARFYRDGADINKDGEPVDDDINAYNAVMQAIGFAPADRALIYQARTMALQFEAEVEQHKAQLLDAAWAAFNVGDTETFEEVRGRLVALGRRYPGLVKNDTIERSFRSRTQSVQDSVTGVTLNSSLRPEQIRRFFDDLE